MKITKRQLRKIIREATATGPWWRSSSPGDLSLGPTLGPTREDRLARLASDILRHYDTVFVDVGEIHVDDLIDHWVGQGNPDPGPEIRTEIIRQNYGNEYFGGDDY